MRIIIAGSRTFVDYPKLKIRCIEIIKGFKHGRIVEYMGMLNIVIISGCASGADRLGEKFAKEMLFDLVMMPANWDRDGKSAGYKRNVEMAKYAQKDDGVLIAFWDGQSKGTKHMIDIAKKYGLEIYVEKF
jgi:hypothetical protein